MRAALVVTALAAGLVTAAPAAQAADDTHYTTSATLTQASCPVQENYPKPGVPDRHWTKARTAADGAPYRVGVRYTVNDYALVLDYARSDAGIHWGFMRTSCLDPGYAEDVHGARIPELHGLDSHDAVVPIPFQPAHDGDSVASIHATSAGSLRSAPQSFVIGNVRDGDEFRITTAHCGAHAPTAWILGYAPASGRWGYLEAMHLAACR
ncbi:hypothetical protein [Amycolatopsis sp. PS_44_ISF1]|uniref:hypothetical protein n=1 Tax=Amycolatopsis sp. PS_44_ISF1 TaxID=2974917 RepID=UPI0028DE6D4C|nr:hypothetical protein [Amycolatopsis sp. PS_44_ISF1]MDT8912343.1 hypothetical protein [Amycolatopsis sp. PS_44_ISF1]